MEVYEPAEDTFLLKKWIKRAKGAVLEIGTGSSVLALEAAGNPKVRHILAIDINKNIPKPMHAKIKYQILDFQKAKGKFDTIICNPPYLPQDKGIEDPALYGGKRGYEFIERLIPLCSDLLETDGKILLLFSSFTNKAKVDEIIKTNLFDFRQLEKKHISFEDLFVYEIKKSRLLKVLQENGLSKIAAFDKGKRGLIYTAMKGRKKVAIKIKNPSTEARLVLQNEAKFLKLANTKKVGPKFLFSVPNAIVYEFAEGEFIFDYLIHCPKSKIKSVFKGLLEQCRKMDSLGFSKEEMHRPWKHVILGKKFVLLDFERAHFGKAHNLTQCCQFFCWGKTLAVLESRGFIVDVAKIRSLAKEHGKDTLVKDILACISNK